MYVHKQAWGEIHYFVKHMIVWLMTTWAGEHLNIDHIITLFLFIFFP